MARAITDRTTLYLRRNRRAARESRDALVIDACEGARYMFLMACCPSHGVVMGSALVGVAHMCVGGPCERAIRRNARLAASHSQRAIRIVQYPATFRLPFGPSSHVFTHTEYTVRRMESSPLYGFTGDIEVHW